MAACPECGADPVRVGQVRTARRSTTWVSGFQCDGCGVIRTLTDDDPAGLHEVSKAMAGVIKKRIIQLAIVEQLLIAAGAAVGWLAGSWVIGLVAGAFVGVAVFVPALVVTVMRRHLN